VLLACLVCQMGLGLGGYIFAVFLKPIVVEMGWSRAAFSASGGPFLLAMALASPLVGTLTERAGARLVFSTGIIGVAVALILFSYMTSLWQFYALGFLLGAAATCLGDIPAGAVVSQWFVRARGVALGVVYVGSNVGGAIVPIAATEIAAVSSWRVALRVLAVAGCLCILPFAAWGVRERRAGPPAHPEPLADSTAAVTAPALGLGEALRTANFWILGGVLFSFYFYYLGVNHHLVAFLSDAGFSDAAAARRFSAAVAVGIIGKIGMGLVADRVAARHAIVLNFTVMTIGSFVLLAVGVKPALLPLFLVLHGLTVAAENVMLPMVVAECFGVQHLARIYGTLMLVLLPAGVAGPTFAGYLFDTLGSYRVAFATFAILNVVAVGALLWLRPLSDRLRGG
jgi:MFS family permease